MRSMTISLALATALTGTAASAFEPGAGPTSPAHSSQRSAEPGSAEPGDGFGWPLENPHRVVRAFDAPRTEWGPGHRGVDLVGNVGQPVRAAGTGVVVYAGWLIGRNVVSIQHPGGLRTTYEPVTPEIEVGQSVTRGQRIGRLDPGHPECAAAKPRTCLHWGARRRHEYLNPLGLLARGTVRLLPWSPPGSG